VLSSTGKNVGVEGSIYSEIDLTNINIIWSGNTQQTVQLAERVEAHIEFPVRVEMVPTPTYHDASFYLCGQRDMPFREPVIKPVEPLVSSEPITPQCYLTAESTIIPYPTSDLAGTHSGRSCIIQLIDCPEQRSGFMQTKLQVFASARDGTWVDTELDIVAPMPPSSTFIYKLPPYIHINKANKITLNITPMDTGDVLEKKMIDLYLWDWQNEVWTQIDVDIPQSARSTSLSFENQEAQKFYNPTTNAIEMKIDVNNTTYPQYKLPIVIEGIW
jgi:hypothetical protein